MNRFERALALLAVRTSTPDPNKLPGYLERIE